MQAAPRERRDAAGAAGDVEYLSPGRAQLPASVHQRDKRISPCTTHPAHQLTPSPKGTRCICAPRASPGRDLSPTDPPRGKHLPPALGIQSSKPGEKGAFPAAFQCHKQDSHHPRCGTRPLSARLNPKASPVPVAQADPFTPWCVGSNTIPTHSCED